MTASIASVLRGKRSTNRGAAANSEILFVPKRLASKVGLLLPVWRNGRRTGLKIQIRTFRGVSTDFTIVDTTPVFTVWNAISAPLYRAVSSRSQSVTISVTAPDVNSEVVLQSKANQPAIPCPVSIRC
jgi:hypothetical protein